MTEPPDHSDPPDGLPPDEPEHDGGFQIVEPPVNPEDTRRLHPLGSSRPAGQQRPPVIPPLERPPATVLSEAPATPPPRLTEPPTGQDETDRVRLVPRVANPGPWRVILQTAGPSRTRIGLNVWESVVIGRPDPAGETLLYLDMTSYNARELGVSRQHAALIPGVDALYLADLGSTNGTWINGKFLEPGKRYPLSAGDRIELGLLELTVRVVGPLTRNPDE
jgi:hypothetical protein